MLNLRQFNTSDCQNNIQLQDSEDVESTRNVRLLTGGAIGRSTDLRFTGCGFGPWLDTIAQWPWASYLRLCASVTKQYTLVLTKGDNLLGWESNRGSSEK